MTSRIMSAAVALVAAFGLSGCENAPVSKQTQGAVIGGVGGALVGSAIGGGTGRILATGAGAVAGAVIGAEVAGD